MSLFIDCAEYEKIRIFHEMGLVRGVTTNPTIVSQSGLNGLSDLKYATVKICELVSPYPVCVELTSNDRDDMVDEAVKFSKWSDNIVVKVPIHGVAGEQNLEVIRMLESELDVRVNATALMSAQQCYLASLAGASYVSLFCGRINDMGYDSCVEISKCRRLLDQSGIDSKIICASTREVLNVVQWLGAGAHIVTLVPTLLEKMIVHPYTKETVRQFLDDAKKLRSD